MKFAVNPSGLDFQPSDASYSPNFPKVQNFWKVAISTFLLAGIFQIQTSWCQEVVISDPELELRFEKPKKWTVYDDTLNLYVLPPDQGEKKFSYTYNYLKITYFEAPSDGFDLYPDFSPYSGNTKSNDVLKSGDDWVDGKKVEWIVVDSLHTIPTRRVIFYRYSRHGQDFHLTGVANRDAFRKFFRSFRRIARSFVTQRVR